MKMAWSVVLDAVHKLFFNQAAPFDSFREAGLCCALVSAW